MDFHFDQWLGYLTGLDWRNLTKDKIYLIIEADQFKAAAMILVATVAFVLYTILVNQV